MALQSPLILTLKLDPQTFEFTNNLRRQYFPVERNVIPAHVTLFHALPSEQKREISQALRVLCSQTSEISLYLPMVRFLGKGVAIAIESPALMQLRQGLAAAWKEWLSGQDRQPYQPHITIQNKVSPTDARQLHRQLSEAWQPVSGVGKGLLLWYYRGGPWELASEFSFVEDKSSH